MCDKWRLVWVKFRCYQSIDPVFEEFEPKYWNRLELNSFSKSKNTATAWTFVHNSIVVGAEVGCGCGCCDCDERISGVPTTTTVEGRITFSGVCGGVGGGLIKNGCWRAARAEIRFIGLKVRSFWSKSWPWGQSPGTTTSSSFGGREGNVLWVTFVSLGHSEGSGVPITLKWAN